MASKFGSSPQVMDKFGFPNPKPRRELTPQAMVLRSAKARATRKLRGTRSSKQLAAIKATGDFTLTVGVPQPASQPATREGKNVVVEAGGDLVAPARVGPTMAVNSAGKA